MGDGAAEGAASWICGWAIRAWSMDQGGGLGDQVAFLDLHVPAHGADAHAAITGGVDVGQFGDAVEVDQHRRLGQPKVHGRDQALPAGQDLGVVACARPTGGPPPPPTVARSIEMGLVSWGLQNR